MVGWPLRVLAYLLFYWLFLKAITSARVLFQSANSSTDLFVSFTQSWFDIEWINFLLCRPAMLGYSIVMFSLIGLKWLHYTLGRRWPTRAGSRANFASETNIKANDTINDYADITSKPNKPNYHLMREALLNLELLWGQVSKTFESKFLEHPNLF